MTKVILSSGSSFRSVPVFSIVSNSPIGNGLIFFIACSLVLQGNTLGQGAPYFLTPIKADGDTPVVLEWESEPKGVYTVEYSVGLNGDWQTMDQDFPSQGATTRWTDRGNPDYGNFRHSTADPWVPYRFYRVRFDQFMATNGPIAVAVTNISNGAELGEVVEVRGFVTATQRIAAVKLLVDGFLVAKAPGPQFALAFETREFANGPHRLYVVAQDGGAIESTDEVNELGEGGPDYGVTNLTVSFTNFIYNARLRFEQFLPEIGDTQAVFAVWASPRDWQLDVTDRDGTVVHRTFLGSGKRVEVHWDGADTNGAYLNPQLLAYRSVIGAWNYVCRRTQWNPQHPDPAPNVARSVYWPECGGDFIYGYGPQTEPDRDPADPLEQADLLENDHASNASDP